MTTPEQTTLLWKAQPTMGIEEFEVWTVVRDHEDRKHRRDGSALLGCTYFDVIEETGWSIDKVLRILHSLEAKGLIVGKGFYCRAGGGAKRWKTAGAMP